MRTLGQGRVGGALFLPTTLPDWFPFLLALTHTLVYIPHRSLFKTVSLFISLPWDLLMAACHLQERFKHHYTVLNTLQLAPSSFLASYLQALSALSLNTQSFVCGLELPTSPGNLLEMKNLKPYPDLLNKNWIFHKNLRNTVLNICSFLCHSKLTALVKVFVQKLKQKRNLWVLVELPRRLERDT